MWIIATNTLSPRFRWKRSRWGRFCPVELSQGNMVQGRMEFSIGYVRVYQLLYTHIQLFNYLVGNDIPDHQLALQSLYHQFLASDSFQFPQSQVSISFFFRYISKWLFPLVCVLYVSSNCVVSCTIQASGQDVLPVIIRGSFGFHAWPTGISLAPQSPSSLQALCAGTTHLWKNFTD